MHDVCWVCGSEWHYASSHHPSTVRRTAESLAEAVFAPLLGWLR